MPSLKSTSVIRHLGPEHASSADVEKPSGAGEDPLRGEETSSLGHYLVNRMIDDGGDGGINDVMRGIMYSYAHAIQENRLGLPPSMTPEVKRPADQESGTCDVKRDIDRESEKVAVKGKHATQDNESNVASIATTVPQRSQMDGMVENKTNVPEKLPTLLKRWVEIGESIGAIQPLAQYIADHTVDDRSVGATNEVLRAVMFAYARVALEERIASSPETRSIAPAPPIVLNEAGEQAEPVGPYIRPLHGFSPGSDVVIDEEVGFAFCSKYGDYSNNNTAESESTDSENRPGFFRRWVRAFKFRSHHPQRRTGRPKRGVMGWFRSCVGVPPEDDEDDIFPPGSRDGAFRQAVFKRASILVPGRDGQYRNI